VSAPADGAARLQAVFAPIRVHNPVLFTLVIAACAAAVSSGFVGVAPNRLVSGRPVALWIAAPAIASAGIAALGIALLAACLAAPRRLLHGGVACSAAVLLLLVLFALGAAARRIAATAPPAARVMPGAAFWIVAVCAMLMLGDAVQRRGLGPAARLAVVAAVAGGALALAETGVFDSLSIAREYAIRRGVFADALLRHVVLVAAAVGPALAIGFPLGIGVAKFPRWQDPVFAVLNTLQILPSIARFGLLIAPLSALANALPAAAALGIAGVGMTPAIIALVLYALLPVVRNTAAGLAGVDPAVVDAARGMGMTPRQALWRVELPLASPVLFAGLRIVVVQAIGLAVVAALIGAGGLGTFVFEGLGQYAVDLVLLGALPAMFLAFAADFLLQTAAAALRRRIMPGQTGQ
jgi:osmoprotectant transport system permease protein